MKCEQCGQKIEQDWKFCPNCKNPITVKNEGTTNIGKVEETKDNSANVYISIFVISIVCSCFLHFPWGFLVAIITIITGKIKCPNSKVIKVLFWLTILFIILFVIFMMWMMIVCGKAVDSCLTFPEWFPE